MRLGALDLIAYGPFTGRRLEFTSPFTIAYGLNEAGKSSALRALLDALYGIPGQTPDAFLHPYNSLRIGVDLSYAGGDLRLIRRKARQQSLRAPDDSTVVEDSALERALHGIPRGTFETMFGISHKALVEGGRALAAGEGEVGELLFVSAAGLAGMQATLARLDEKTGDLYAPSGRNRSIHRLLRELRDADKDLKDKQVLVARFQENREALDQIAEDLAALETKVDAARRESERLSRIRGALPTISDRRAVESEIQSLAEVLCLPDDYGDRLRDVENRLREARSAEEGHRQDLARAIQAIAGLDVPEDLIVADEPIRALFERKAVIQKAREDCIRRQAEVVTLRRSVLDQVQELRPGMELEKAAGLEPGLVARKRVQEIAPGAVRLQADREALDRGLQQARRKLAEFEGQLHNLPTVPDTTELAAAVERARRGFDPRRSQELQVKIAAADETVSTALRTLAPWKGLGEDLEAMAAPEAETVEELREVMHSAGNEERTAREKLVEADRQLAEAQADRERIVAFEAVPTIGELAAARELRDFGWTAVKQLWKNGDAAAEEEFLTRTGQSELATAYEGTVAGADNVADHIREHARQVEQLAALDIEIAARVRRRAEAETAVATSLKAAEVVRKRWNATWSNCGVTPQSPAAMLGWLRRRQEIIRQVQGLRELRLELKSLNQAEAIHAADLARLLPAHGTIDTRSAADMLAAADAELTRAKQAQEVRQALLASQDLQRIRIEGEIAGLGERTSEWQRNWAEALDSARLPSGLSPDAAEAYLNCVREITNGLRTAADLDHRIATMQDDAERFAADVAGLVSRLLPEAIGVEPEAAIAQLHRALTEAHQNWKLREQERTRQREIDKKLAAAAQNASRHAGELDALCREAAAPDADSARQCWLLSSRRRNLEKRIMEYDERLRLVSAGKTVDEFLAEAAAVDADSIAGRLDDIEVEIASLRKQRTELEEKRRGLDANAAGMRGGDLAASAAQHISGLVGRLSGDVEEYVRLRTATFVIRKAIERYRDRNQGPVLERAAQLFSDLTCGSFTSLRVEDDEGSAILVGIRANGEVVKLTGMSDGTLDQLYLALRIASLEHYFAAREPVPFIVDDVLLNFDDERAAAALAALDALSQKTQVIFFTHHKRLVELAERCTRVSVCEL